MHRATRGSGLTTDSADGSMAKDTAVALDHDGAATSALTECAFSWKFANSSGIRALLDTRGMLQPLRGNRTSREKVQDSHLPSF
jgi:hypothetical protein